MKTRGQHRRAFTLIELLAVVAILLLLLSLLVPGLSEMKARSLRTQCQSNMRQMYSQLLNFAAEYGQFPTNNNWNCTNFRSGTRNLVDQQFKKAGISERVFYCPALAQQAPNRVPEAWNYPPDGNNEVQVGYCYLGNPIQGRIINDLYKYSGPYEGASNLTIYATDLNERFVVLADICAASRTYQKPVADQVAAAGWGIFPHSSVETRKGCNVLTAAGAVRWNPIEKMTMNWEFDNPTDLYW